MAAGVPYIISRYTFTAAGDSGRKIADVATDPTQGFMAPGKSCVIENHGPGTLYFVISSDGSHFSDSGSLTAGQVESYEYRDGVDIHTVIFWASAAGTIMSFRAVPGRD